MTLASICKKRNSFSGEYILLRLINKECVTFESMSLNATKAKYVQLKSRHLDRSIFGSSGLRFCIEISVLWSRISASNTKAILLVITFVKMDTQRPLIFKRLLGQYSGRHKSCKRNKTVKVEPLYRNQNNSSNVF